MRIKIFTIMLGLILSASLYAQTGGGTSPYSRLGMGDVSEPHLIFMRNMGGLGAAYVDIYHINVANPASLAYLRATSFDVGITTKHTTLSDADNSQGIWSGNLEYLALAFPLSNPINEVLDRKIKNYAFGMGFYLLPYSQVGYNITSSEENSDIGTIERNFQGSGGSYKAMWGNSFKYKDFSVGLNMGVLFGKFEYLRNVYFLDLENSFRDRFSNDYSISGFTYNLGFMYHIRLNEKEVRDVRGTEMKLLQFGLHGKSKSSFSTNSSLLYESRLFEVRDQVLARDTLLYDDSLDGKGKLPAELSFGAVYQDGNKLSLGMNVDLSFWDAYKNDANPGELNNSYRVSFGGYYRPNYKSFNKYFHRVYYRFGAYYGNDPRSADGKQLDIMGLHFGMGLPFVVQRKISHINLGLEYGLRGTDAPISERFFKISAGFTFNDDEWFIQRKYN